LQKEGKKEKPGKKKEMQKAQIRSDGGTTQGRFGQKRGERKNSERKNDATHRIRPHLQQSDTSPVEKKLRKIETRAGKPTAESRTISPQNKCSPEWSRIVKKRTQF